MAELPFDPRRLHQKSQKNAAPMFSIPMSFVTPNLCDPAFTEVIFTVPENFMIQLVRRVATFKKITEGNMPHIEISIGNWVPDEWTSVASYSHVGEIIARSELVTQIELEQPYTTAVRTLDAGFTLDHGYWYQSVRIKKVGGVAPNNSYLTWAYHGWKVDKSLLA